MPQFFLVWLSIALSPDSTLATEYTQARAAVPAIQTIEQHLWHCFLRWVGKVAKHLFSSETIKLNLKSESGSQTVTMMSETTSLPKVLMCQRCHGNSLLTMMKQCFRYYKFIMAVKTKYWLIHVQPHESIKKQWQYFVFQFYPSGVFNLCLD